MQYAKNEIIDYLLPLTNILLKRKKETAVHPLTPFEKKDDKEEIPSTIRGEETSVKQHPTVSRLSLPSDFLLAEHREVSSTRVVYGGDTKKFFDLIKKEGIRLPAGFSRSEFLSIRDGSDIFTSSSIPTPKFTSFLLKRIQGIAILTNPMTTEVYGDFYYVLTLIASWSSSAFLCVDNSNYKEIINTQLVRALQEYLRLHFSKQHEGKNVVFTPRIPDEEEETSFESAVARVNDFRRYAPPHLIQNDLNIAYPKSFYSTTWPRESILATLSPEYVNQRNAAYLHLLSYSQFQRYVLVGLAVLSVVFCTVGKAEFEATFIPYFLSLAPTHYKTVTTSQLFPGLYLAFILSRPSFKEVAVSGIQFQRELVYRQPRLLNPFLKYFKACLLSKNATLEVVSEKKDILFQNVEVLLNELFTRATSVENLVTILFTSAYDYKTTYSRLKKNHYSDYITRGFVFKEQQTDTADPAQTGILQKIHEARRGKNVHDI